MIHLPEELQRYAFELGCQEDPTEWSHQRRYLRNQKHLHPFAMTGQSTCRKWKESISASWIYFIPLSLQLDMTDSDERSAFEFEAASYYQALALSATKGCNLFVRWDLYSL